MAATATPHSVLSLNSLPPQLQYHVKKRARSDSLASVGSIKSIALSDLLDDLDANALQFFNNNVISEEWESHFQMKDEFGRIAVNFDEYDIEVQEYDEDDDDYEIEDIYNNPNGNEITERHYFENDLDSRDLINGDFAHDSNQNGEYSIDISSGLFEGGRRRMPLKAKGTPGRQSAAKKQAEDGTTLSYKRSVTKAASSMKKRVKFNAGGASPTLSFDESPTAKRPRGRPSLQQNKNKLLAMQAAAAVATSFPASQQPLSAKKVMIKKEVSSEVRGMNKVTKKQFKASDSDGLKKKSPKVTKGKGEGSNGTSDGHSEIKKSIYERHDGLLHEHSRHSSLMHLHDMNSHNLPAHLTHSAIPITSHPTFATLPGTSSIMTGNGSYISYGNPLSILNSSTHTITLPTSALQFDQQYQTVIDPITGEKTLVPISTAELFAGSIISDNINPNMQYTTQTITINGIPTLVSVSLDGLSTVVVRIGAYTREERQQRIDRFRVKKMRRVWRKQIKYDCRKKLADTRPRVKGRFVSRAEEGAGGIDSAAVASTPVSEGQAVIVINDGDADRSATVTAADLSGAKAEKASCDLASMV